MLILEHSSYVYKLKEKINTHNTTLKNKSYHWWGFEDKGLKSGIYLKLKSWVWGRHDDGNLGGVDEMLHSVKKPAVLLKHQVHLQIQPIRLLNLTPASISQCTNQYRQKGISHKSYISYIFGEKQQQNLHFTVLWMKLVPWLFDAWFFFMSLRKT